MREETPAGLREASDLDLVRMLGDEDEGARRRAFAVLFDRHSKRAFDLAYRVLGEASLAGDVVQVAFLAVYRKGARFEARAQFTSWLHRIVLNHAIDLQRKERRHRHAPLVIREGGGSGPSGTGAGETLAVPDGGAGPIERTVADERALLVRAAIGELSPKLAQVVVLRYLEGRSYEEIGEVLCLPPGTVKSRLNRAHAALRELLEGRI